MSASREGYSSTVTSRPHLSVGLAITAVTAAAMVALGAGAVAVVVVGAGLVATSLFVSTVRLVVGGGHLVVGQGPWSWPSRSLPADSVLDARAVELTRAQAYGVGMPWRWRTSRMTVRAGATLVLDLDTGEQLRVSTADPQLAARLVRAGQASGRAPSTAPPTQEADDGRGVVMADERHTQPWFGAKRVGYGIRPQTWQGWLIVLGGAALLVVVVTTLSR